MKSGHDRSGTVLAIGGTMSAAVMARMALLLLPVFGCGVSWQMACCCLCPHLKYCCTLGKAVG